MALTNACDLACPFCFVSKNQASLDYKRITSWLVELDAHGCLGVGFGGGEPTLYQSFADLCRYTAQETQLAVTFTTHAHHLDDDLVVALKGNVHFVRVSMDGVNGTYEELRGKSFASLRSRFEAVRALALFGINFLVNARTLPDLDAAVALAIEVGASELLLLPEQPVRGVGGIDGRTTQALGRWVALYRGRIPLSVSVAGSEGMATFAPLAAESGLNAYAHIDATGVLRRSSFDTDGTVIGPEGVMKAVSIMRDR
jgi:MoaA/NifB/PqqE/SkfB family radical SAM enzyme